MIVTILSNKEENLTQSVCFCIFSFEAHWNNLILGDPPMHHVLRRFGGPHAIAHDVSLAKFSRKQKDGGRWSSKNTSREPTLHLICNPSLKAINSKMSEFGSIEVASVIN